ncbi:MAG: hypothetical protein LBS77_03390 [Desulfovibrio sp.]|jgi:hypothetical protein|nr:hypothetical protein [Desulfovibrio sp.]
MKKKSANKEQKGRGWILALSLELLASMLMGLILVWSNIERMDTTYFINMLQNEIREKQNLHAKLEVERGRLLSPRELKHHAEELGMKKPKAGHIRRMELR